MTLNSNKNEPAVVLESVSSVRTALSDLYLEQLLQNKPKTDKVGVIYLFFAPPYLGVCFREVDMGHMDVVCPTKNRPSRVLIILQKLNNI